LIGRPSGVLSARVSARPCKTAAAAVTFETVGMSRTPGRLIAGRWAHANTAAKRVRHANSAGSQRAKIAATAFDWLPTQ
jgi:hypothetical protein